MNEMVINHLDKLFVTNDAGTIVNELEVQHPAAKLLVGFGMQQYGIQSMLKEGHRHLSGLDEAVIKNIDACKQLSQITRTSFGPNGTNKMVINHVDKLFVTNDATILNELEVQHPAAKLLVLAGKAQQEEIGDGANSTISFAKATNQTLEVLGELLEEGSENMDVRNKDEVMQKNSNILECMGSNKRQKK